MKKLFCLLVIAGLARYYHRPTVAPASPASSMSLSEWEQERRAAETRLQGELLAYQVWSHEPPERCPRRAAQVREQPARVEIAKEAAIRVLEQKPGALTNAETRRLNFYKEVSSRMEQGLPVAAEMP